MKRLCILGIMLFAVLVATADELNSKQLRLRNEIVNFLKYEGFMPEINSNGNINFKSEGVTHTICIYASDTSPMYLSFYVSYSYSDEKFTKNALKRIAADVSTYKAVRLEIFRDSYNYSADMYLNDAETFKVVFYKLKSQLDALSDGVSEALDEYGY